jgi:hypothetical protein
VQRGKLKGAVTGKESTARASSAHSMMWAEVSRSRTDSQTLTPHVSMDRAAM